MDDPVRGTAYISGCSQHAGSATSSNIAMTLVVSADGLATTTVEHECLCRHDRWPSPGATLPVTVDRSDPTRLRVEWDEVVPDTPPPTTGNATADAIVAHIQQASPGAQVAVSRETIEATVGKDAADQVMRALQGEPPEDDAVADLERLARLHAAGGLTDEEFAAAKAKLLGAS